MKKWLPILLPLFCIACTTDSAPESSAPPALAPDVQTEQAEVTHTPTASETKVPQAINIVTEDIVYTVNDEPFTGFLAYNSAIEGERPGILVVHEWWGHNEYARSRAVQLAELGYTALALDMYGAGKVADHPDNALEYMQQATENQDQLKMRFLEAKKLLEQQAATDASRIAAIGYCFGGAVVLNMARAGVDLDGVASFHGALASEVDTSPGEVTAKVLVLHGEDDPMIPPEQVKAFKAEMEAASVDYEFIGYPGVQHSFTNPGATEMGKQYDMPLAYDEEADRHSWAALQQFLDSLWAAPAH